MIGQVHLNSLACKKIKLLIENFSPLFAIFIPNELASKWPATA